MAEGTNIEWATHTFNPWIGCTKDRVSRNADNYAEHAATVIGHCKTYDARCFHKQMPINGRVSGEPSDWPAEFRIREFPRLVSA